MTLGLALIFEIFKTLLVLAYFFTSNSSTETNSGIHQTACRSRCLIINNYYSSFCYVILALSSAVTNPPKKTLISMTFQALKMKLFKNSMTFQVYHFLTKKFSI